MESWFDIGHVIEHDPDGIELKKKYTAAISQINKLRAIIDAGVDDAQQIKDAQRYIKAIESSMNVLKHIWNKSNN